jgi:hypothetical protein
MSELKIEIKIIYCRNVLMCPLVRYSVLLLLPNWYKFFFGCFFILFMVFGNTVPDLIFTLFAEIVVNRNEVQI